MNRQIKGWIALLFQTIPFISHHINLIRITLSVTLPITPWINISDNQELHSHMHLLIHPSFYLLNLTEIVDLVNFGSFIYTFHYFDIRKKAQILKLI